MIKDNIKLVNSGVYAIKNDTSGRTYIGSSRNIHQRIKQHDSELRGGRHENHAMQEDADNGDTFTAYLLEPCFDPIRQQLMTQEARYIRGLAKKGYKLYNIQMPAQRDYYTSQKHIVELMANEYCKARFGKGINSWLHTVPAEIEAKYEAWKNPAYYEKNKKIYEKAIKRQKMRYFYKKRFNINYDELCLESIKTGKSIDELRREKLNGRSKVL